MKKAKGKPGRGSSRSAATSKVGKRSRFKLSTTLSVLEDLGVNLYSNSAAVLGEVVANGWDADARTVDIVANAEARELMVNDDGIGMNVDDINHKYLTIGYKRRESGEGRSPSGRAVMGRKGIGKLSIFSLASQADVHTVKNGESIAFRLSLDRIRDAIAQKQDYYPEEIKPATDLKRGTRIVLRQLKPHSVIAEGYLRRRLSRRFSIIGAGQHFEVRVNGKRLTPADREYYDRIEYLWHFGQTPAISLATKALASAPLSGRVQTADSAFSVRGWIGSVSRREQLRSSDGDNLNKIILMVRGKLAHENLLDELTEAGFYASYVMGEIHADFLDLDDRQDIATSSRQDIMEDDPRYAALKVWLRTQLKAVESGWAELRNKAGVAEARRIPAVDEWFSSLGPDQQRRAAVVLGKMNSISVDDPHQKQTLFKQSILAFELYKVKQNLDALEQLTGDEIVAVAQVFESVDDIEATLYYEVVKQRVEVIKQLEKLVNENDKEKFLQAHVYDHLWLIDPGWDRATQASASMEKSIAKLLGTVDKTLPAIYKKGRYDVKYRTTSGRHVLIELKRAGRKVSTDELLPQIRKYAKAMNELLRRRSSRDPFDIIVLVGHELTDWTTLQDRGISEQQLAALGARVILYDQLIMRAKDSYEQYLVRNREASKLTRLLESIQATDFGGGATISLPRATRAHDAKAPKGRKSS